MVGIIAFFWLGVYDLRWWVVGRRSLFVHRGSWVVAAAPNALNLCPMMIAIPGDETLRLVENGLDRLGEAEYPDTAQRLAEEVAEVTQVAGSEDCPKTRCQPCCCGASRKRA